MNVEGITSRIGRARRVMMRATVLTGCISCFDAIAAAEWPSLKLPDTLVTFPIGQKMMLNGMPMRLQGFVSHESPDDLVQILRRHLGGPLILSNSQNARVLGRADGHHYLTIQIKPAGTGSAGTISVTDLGAMASGQVDARASAQALQTRLPAGSQITSDMRSSDGGKTARHLIIINRHDTVRNRDAIVEFMHDDGYRLERDAATNVTMRHKLAPGFSDATTLYFTAPGKEGIAVVVRNGEQTSIVLNTVVIQGAIK